MPIVEVPKDEEDDGAELMGHAHSLLISDEERHPLIIDYTYDIAALSYAAMVFIALGDVAELRVIMETTFALGYRAGQDHDDIESIFADTED